MDKSKQTGKLSRRKQYSAPALEKGLDILELLSGEADGLNLSEIAKYLDRSVGEIFRMLVVLEQRGYVTLLPGTDTYTLTLKMFQLSHRFPPIKRLTTMAGPVMRRLAFKIEQSCHLVIYYEGKGHVVVQQDSPMDRVFSVRLGAEVPLAETCSGHLLLAYADDFERERMLERRPPHHKKLSKKALKAIVERVRAQGFERIMSEIIQDVWDVGYPIFDHSGEMVATLVVPFLAHLNDSNAMGLDEVDQYVAVASQEISIALGYGLENS